MNEFKSDLKYSLNKSDSETLDKFYSGFFADFKSISLVEDLNEQKKGYDKIIKGCKNKIIKIEEKKRRTDYGDILLEVFSNLEKRKPGWIYTSTCDYLSYFIVPSKTIYMLPFDLLQSAFHKNKEDWMKFAEANINGFKICNAKNPGYITQSLAVPRDILFDSIKELFTNNL